MVLDSGDFIVTFNFEVSNSMACEDQVDIFPAASLYQQYMVFVPSELLKVKAALVLL